MNLIIHTEYLFHTGQSPAHKVRSSIIPWDVHSVSVSRFTMYMCGIFFSYSLHGATAPCPITREYLQRRGPDYSNTICREFNRHGLQMVTDTPAPKASMIFSASVLSLRGDSIVEQPLEDPQTGSILCWNGEAWKINDMICKGNDAKPVFDLLLEAIQTTQKEDGSTLSSDEDTAQIVMKVFEIVSGPSAFVFYDAVNQKIFYGRDRLGRRSLLHKAESNERLLVSSVCHPVESNTWTEVQAGCICVLDLEKYTHHGLRQADIIKQGEGIGDPPERVKSEQTGELFFGGIFGLVQTP
jgi:asparagine synthetase B (glutamine-hydrolysing)